MSSENWGFREIFQLDSLGLKQLNDTLRALWAKVMGGIGTQDLERGFKQLINSKVGSDNFGSLISQSMDEIVLQVVNSSQYQGAVLYKVEILSDTAILAKAQQRTTLSARVYLGSEDITGTLPESGFTWTRHSADTTGDAAWNRAHQGMKQVTVSTEDVPYQATFRCDVDQATA